MKFKKVLCTAVATATILSSVTAFADTSFNDLSADHWSYASVMQLVGDGTVKGYEDGGFHPDGTVTRAEFVKMIGKGENVRKEQYQDVPADHWGYEYIMASGLKTDGNSFLHDTPIKRGEVLELIWQRNGSVTGIVAPGSIKSQCDTPDAAAWGYTYGIMIGDDGHNLRLSEPLTRAEAAALIVRGRNYASAQKINFENTVSEDLLKLVLNQCGLFDGDVSDLSKPVTNGEIAMAALRIMYGEDTPIFFGFPSASANCLYGKEWGYVAYNYLEQTDYSEEKVNSQARLQDAVGALSMGMVGKCADTSSVPVNLKGYPGVAMNGKLKFSMAYAKGMGIEFKADGTFDPDKGATFKDVAMILLQLDGKIGLKRSYTGIEKSEEKIQKDFSRYPANWQSFPAIIEDIPTEVYAYGISEGYESDYDFAREYPEFFVNALNRLAQSMSGEKYNVEFTYYPETLFTNNNDYKIMRVKLSVSGATEGLTFKDVLGEQFTGENSAFESCFVQIETKTPFLTSVYPESDLIVTKIFK